MASYSESELKAILKEINLFEKEGPFTAKAFYDLCSYLLRMCDSKGPIVVVRCILDEQFHRFPLEELRKIDSLYKGTHNLGKKARKVIRWATARNKLVHGRFAEVYLDTLDEDHFKYLCNIVVNDGGDTLFLAYCSGCGKALMEKIMRILWEDRTK
tara:strand:+ start:357 stop:824 length:468 start_codon:yes stop_codon:yes gene_type:complete